MNAHEQRQFQPDQDADGEHQPVQHDMEVAQPRKAKEQQRRRHAAKDGDSQLHLDETAGQRSSTRPRQPGADAQGRQIDADDERELRHRVAEHVAGERPGQQLVDQAAGRDDEHVDIKQVARRVHCLTLDSGRHNHGDADDDCCDHDGQGDVLVLLDALAERERGSTRSTNQSDKAKHARPITKKISVVTTCTNSFCQSNQSTAFIGVSLSGRRRAA